MILTNRDTYGFELAIKAARLSDCRFAHGASILYGRKVLSIAHNKIKTHPAMKRYGSHVVSIHAEMGAIIHARTDIAGATCYSARVSKDGKYLISKPCATCELLLRESGIYNVIYYNGSQFVNERYLR